MLPQILTPICFSIYQIGLTPIEIHSALTILISRQLNAVYVYASTDIDYYLLHYLQMYVQ